MEPQRRARSDWKHCSKPQPNAWCRISAPSTLNALGFASLFG